MLPHAHNVEKIFLALELSLFLSSTDLKLFFFSFLSTPGEEYWKCYIEVFGKEEPGIVEGKITGMVQLNPPLTSKAPVPDQVELVFSVFLENKLEKALEVSIVIPKDDAQKPLVIDLAEVFPDKLEKDANKVHRMVIGYQQPIVRLEIFSCDLGKRTRAWLSSFQLSIGMSTMPRTPHHWSK